MLPIALPFPKCWWVEHNLLAGPAFSGNSETETWQNLNALSVVDIGAIISLIPLEDVIWKAELRTRIEKEILLRFSFRVFPLQDGGVPRRSGMRLILDAMDRELTRGRKIFLHCLAGRGRTGMTVGCWLARHGLAEGIGTLDRIAELRSQAGLSLPSPETDAQRGLSVSWRYRE